MYSTPLQSFIKTIILIGGVVINMAFLHFSELIFNPVALILTATLVGSITAYLMDLVDRR